MKNSENIRMYQSIIRDFEHFSKFDLQQWFY